MSDFQRRGFLTGAAAFVVATSATPVGTRRATADDKPPQPIRGQNRRRSLMRLKAGAVREMHWQPNSEKLQYHIEGQSRMTVYASGSAAGTFDYQPGDVGYVPRNMPHYNDMTGRTPVRYLELWKSDKFSDVSLRQWLAFTPYEFVRAP